MTEKILEISNYYDGDYSGFLIKTNQQEISMVISAHQSCCEDYGELISTKEKGYLITDEDFDYFVGSDLLEIKITDKALNCEFFKKENLSEEYTDTVFVDIITSKGVFQFVAYNSHNGYYGHDVIIKSKQLTERTTI